MPRAVWHLLIDYDRCQDVPGTELGPVTPEEPRLIDYEDEPDYEKTRLILAARLQRCGHSITDFEMRPSTNGWHVTMMIEPPPLNPPDAVALQAICGSDPLRESCNLQRARRVEAWCSDIENSGDDEGDVAAFWRLRWNVLYEPNELRRKAVAP